jgi:uncharacterized membrane protein YeiB
MKDIQVGPVSAADRIELLDVLRGFALSGVLLANMTWFTGTRFMPPEVLAERPLALIDGILEYGLRFFVRDKFITIFAFLFGLGVAMQLLRAEESGTRVERVRQADVRFTGDRCRSCDAPLGRRYSRPLRADRAIANGSYAEVVQANIRFLVATWVLPVGWLTCPLSLGKFLLGFLAGRPAEWLWRTLTYRARQPMQRSVAAEARAVA